MFPKAHPFYPGNQIQLWYQEAEDRMQVFLGKAWIQMHGILVMFIDKRY